MARDTAQQIAELESKLARLKERERKRTTHEKVLVGSVLMSAALRDQQTGAVVLRALQTGLTRDKERAALADFMAKLAG